MIKLTDDDISKLKDTSTKNRYIVVYNGTDNTIYPNLIGYDTVNDKILTDIDKENLPSGFILESKQYKILTFPKYVKSGRIGARTQCNTVSDLYGKGLDGLLCLTGDCHQSYDTSSGKPEDVTYNVSDKGLLCNVKGGQAPATILEFSFVQNTDYYDVSQVDGNNLSAQMEPIINQNPSPQGANPDYWCKPAGCSASLKNCPPELRVYDNDNKFVACQSICAAMGGIGTNMNSNKTLNQDGTQHYQGGTPPGPFNNFTGKLKENDLKSYNFLANMYLTNYYWDAGSKNKGDDREWTNTGTWIQDTDKTKCPLNCSGDICTVPENCISTETLVCCKLEPGNICGDPGASPPISPSFNRNSDQGCSPYVKSYNTPDYAPHLCWSESWPKSSDGQNYHDIFKNKCKNAYSWAFDDFSSTFTCNSSTDTPVHYFVQFYNYDSTPDSLNITSPSPSPSPSKKKTKPFLFFPIIIFSFFIILLFLFFVLKKN